MGPVFFATMLASIPMPAASVAATPAPVKCAIPKPCALFSNTSSGPAVRGVSTSGAGLVGSSGSGNYLDPGTDGESTNVSGNDSGGSFGLDFFTTGTAPTYGITSYGSYIGLYAETEAAGTSSPGYALYGGDVGGTSTQDFNAGVFGASQNGAGVIAVSNAYADAPYVPGASRYGLFAEANGSNASGVYASSDNYAIQAFNSSSESGITIGSQSVFFEALSEPAGSPPDFAVIDASGNEQLSGTLTTSGGSAVRHTGSSGITRKAYGSEATVPEIEDVGEGRLTNGRGDVAIDAALGDSIDSRRPYHVFVTPEGDCNGLYVTQKTAAGFVVRELRGGRSSLDFEYRIIARPLHADGARLAVAPPLPHFTTPRGIARRIEASHRCPFLRKRASNNDSERKGSPKPYSIARRSGNAYVVASVAPAAVPTSAAIPKSIHRILMMAANEMTLTGVVGIPPSFTATEILI